VFLLNDKYKVGDEVFVRSLDKTGEIISTVLDLDFDFSVLYIKDDGDYEVKGVYIEDLEKI